MAPTSTEAHSKISSYFNNCGYLTPSTTDIKSWTALTLPTSVATAAGASVGLFGYDITCLESMCAHKSDYYNFCDFLVGSGIDGWSLGVYAEYKTNVFYLGQSNAVTGDVIHEEKKMGFYGTCKVLSTLYSITATGTGVNANTIEFGAYYGLGKFCLYRSPDFGYSKYKVVTTSASTVNAKFQHADEN